MSMNFGLTDPATDTSQFPGRAGQLSGPIQMGNTGASNLVGGPVGSIYQPSSFFPRNQTAGKITMTPLPPASNFGAQKFPNRVWNTVANFGNALNIFRPKFTGTPGQE
jgi:hypothetical protein